MHITAGKLKSLMREADKEDERAHLLNPENFHRMVEEAVGRLSGWCSAHDEWAKPLQLYVLHGTTRSPFDITVYIDKYQVYDVSFPDEDPSNVNVEVAARAMRKLKNTVVHWLIDHKDEVKEFCLPVPVTDGRWWADENYYPIRPVWEGEDTKFKPEPDWTLVNGTTGDVIKETRERKTDEQLVHPGCVQHLIARAHNRLREWINAQLPRKDLAFYCYEDGSDRVVQVGNKSSNPDEYFEFDVLVQLTDPMSPEAVLQEDGNYDVEYDITQSVVDALEEVARPMVVASGAWWANEELYPVRPVYEGESSELPPKKGWTTVDPVTYDEVRVR